MQNVNGSAPRRPVVRVLVANCDSTVRSLLAELLRKTEGVSAVVDAEDGAEAVELARRLAIHVAVLDLDMPRLDGVQAARLLLGLQPSMSVALHSSDPDRLRARAAGLGLPLFDKLDFDDLVAWVEQQARAFAGRTPRSTASRLELSCSLCGYGIVSGAPPPQCPVCHAVAAWRKPRPGPACRGAGPRRQVALMRSSQTATHSRDSATWETRSSQWPSSCSASASSAGVTRWRSRATACCPVARSNRLR
jgi:CheY-like chemotaxis protein